MSEITLDLKTFVSETIKEVIEGAVDAQGHVEALGALVNPTPYFSQSVARAGVQAPMGQAKRTTIQSIDFDVAVTRSKGSGSKGGIGVFFGPVVAGSSGQSDRDSTSVNRIRFSIPFSLPKPAGEASGKAESADRSVQF